MDRFSQLDENETHINADGDVSMSEAGGRGAARRTARQEHRVQRVAARNPARAARIEKRAEHRVERVAARNPARAARIEKRAEHREERVAAKNPARAARIEKRQEKRAEKREKRLEKIATRNPKRAEKIAQRREMRAEKKGSHMDDKLLKLGVLDSELQYAHTLIAKFPRSSPAFIFKKSELRASVSTLAPAKVARPRTDAAIEANDAADCRAYLRAGPFKS